MGCSAADPLVSIVIPTFNQGSYIEETLLSILNQDYQNLEVIVIDGKSTDDTLSIIEKYEEFIAYWVSEKDAGQADAINKGWYISKGKYLCWLNSDDLLAEDAISTAVNVLENNNDIGYIYGDLILIDQNGCEIGYKHYSDYDFEKMIRYAGWISQPGSLFRKDIYDCIGGLDINLQFQMDLDYWIRIGLKYQIQHINKPLAFFRIHPESKSSSKTIVAANDILYIYKKLFKNTALPHQIIKHQSEAWSNAYLYSAQAMFQGGDFGESLRRTQASLKCYPLIIFNMEFLNLFLNLFLMKLPLPISRNIHQIKKKVKMKFKKSLFKNRFMIEN